MLGVTLAPISGLFVSDIIAGRKPAVDVRMLDPNRYS
jgi:glycine/D-amino acid oxidase-like deaminating enzyme